MHYALVVYPQQHQLLFYVIFTTSSSPSSSSLVCYSYFTLCYSIDSFFSHVSDIKIIVILSNSTCYSTIQLPTAETTRTWVLAIEIMLVSRHTTSLFFFSECHCCQPIGDFKEVIVRYYLLLTAHFLNPYLYARWRNRCLLSARLVPFCCCVYESRIPTTER